MKRQLVRENLQKDFPHASHILKSSFRSTAFTHLTVRTATAGGAVMPLRQTAKYPSDTFSGAETGVVVSFCDSFR